MTVTKTKSYTMAELRASKKGLYIKNNTGFLWTLHEGSRSSDSRIDIELQPAGQPNSITYLPPKALDAPGVARHLALRKITVSPDLEDEMVELMSNGAQGSKKLLEQFQITVEESPQRRAIDVRDKMDELMERVERKRITPQGQQSVTSSSMVDEFINPAPIRSEEGKMFDPRTSEFAPENAPVVESTEIKSVTLTPPVRSNPEEN